MTLAETVDQELSKGYARVRAFEHDGQKYWLKQREQLSPRMRLQKGNASRAFDAELAAFQALSDKTLPIADLVASGPDWMVIADGGTLLRDMLHFRLGNPDNLPAFAAAGQALAQWHAAGYAHGRPAVKDILWNGTRIAFIDLERYAETRNSTRGKMLDLVIFVHSALAEVQAETEELAVAVTAYRAHGGEDIWLQAQTWARRMAWLKLLLAPVKLRKPGRGRDIRAVAMALDYFTKK